MNYNGTWMPQYGQFQSAWQGQRPEVMQGYPQPQQMAPVQAQGQQQGFFSRPVASREEAVAAQIDFFGPGVLMPDFGHGAVYFKRFNQQTGSCDFMTFRLDGQQGEPSAPQEETPTPEYATRQDMEEMRQVIQGLAADIDTLRGRGGKRLADE